MPFCHRDLDGDGANDLMAALVLPGGATESYAYDINNAGQVAGSYLNAQGHLRARLWTGGGGIDLGTFGGQFSDALGINDGGQVVGLSANTAGQMRAFIWDQVHGMIDLGNSTGYTAIRASAINAAGCVVGSAYNSSNDPNGTAFRWTPNQPNGVSGTMTNLDWLPYAIGASAGDLNDAGLIVGSSLFFIPPYDDDPGYYYYVGTTWENGVPIDLNSLVIGGASRYVETANAVNAEGQIVGSGIAGDTHAVLFTPIHHTFKLSINDVSVVE